MNAMTKPHRNPEAALGQRFVPWFMACAAGVMLAMSARAQNSGGLDYGDAPMPYPTLKQSNGASHVIKAPVYLGKWVDDEADGQPGVNATGDDLSPAGATGDEDGVQILDQIGRAHV